MSNQDRTTQRQWAHKKGIRTTPPQTPQKKITGGELMYSRRVSSSCFFQLTRRIGHHCRQTDSNNINKTWHLLQTTGGKKTNITSFLWGNHRRVNLLYTSVNKILIMSWINLINRFFITIHAFFLKVQYAQESLDNESPLVNDATPGKYFLYIVLKVKIQKPVEIH